MDEIVKDNDHDHLDLVDHIWLFGVKKSVFAEKGEVPTPQTRQKVPLEGENHDVEQYEQNQKGFDHRDGTEINALSSDIITAGQSLGHD